MDKKRLYHIIEWIVALVACGWLIWKIATYEDYAALLATLRSMAWPQCLALLVCVGLMPVNMTLEAWRWRTLINSGNEDKMTWREAHRQVYYSKLAGLITPWRLGEYPARGVLSAESGKDVWTRVLSMGVAGSVTMTTAIVIAGVAGLVFSPGVFNRLGGSYLYSVGVVAVVLAALFLLMPKILKRYVAISQDLLLQSVGQSFVRLVCWCVQLSLVIMALGPMESFGFTGDLFCKTAVYYLLVTITPNVPIVEVGVRGAWAIVVFGTMNAALAGVLLWVINTLLPCLVWFVIRKK